MEGKASAGKRSPGLSPGRDVDKYFHNHRKKQKKKPVDCQAESPDAADNMFELLVVKVSGCSSNVDLKKKSHAAISSRVLDHRLQG